MENVNFQPSGDELERVLMDLGPLLGVTIKEEVQDELSDPTAQPGTALNVSSTPDGGVATGTPGVPGGSGEGGEGIDGTGDPCKASTADSLASPSAARPTITGMRCVLCHMALALTEGTPKLMECLHSVCEPCIKAKIEEKHASSRDFLGAERMTIMCPACRLQCQTANMIDQRFVLEKAQSEHAGSNGGSSGEQQCNSCEDTEPATSYCVDCAEFICDNCVHAHQRLKITKDHTIKSKEDAVAELHAAQGASRNSHDMFCAEHVQERLTLFCETCDRLTCRDCQLQHHRDHKYQFSTEMAAQARANISSLLSEVSYKRVLLGSAMKVIRDRQALIADKKKALVHEITQTVVKLTNAINTRGKQLVLRLNEVCDSKQRTLTEKKEALEQLAAITDHCVEFVTAALETGSDTAVLYAKHSVCAHLQRIKSRRADIPNPEIPVRISLALDKLPDLIRVLSSIGAIVVDGKVDGGSAAGGAASGTSSGGTGGGSGAAPGAQGPYHPPAPRAPTPHSAVVALQHVAMHQSYVHGGANSNAVALTNSSYLPVQHSLRPRSHTPLRHPHVTSTTHPHHLQGMSEMNLRGLLNAQSHRGAQVATRHAQHPAQLAMQQAYQQMMGAYSSNYANATAMASTAVGVPPGGRRSGGPRTPSPAPPPAPPAYPQHQPTAKWHIPQHSLANGGFDMNMANAGSSNSGQDFKITLGRPSAIAPATVTSTNPKTPSPSLNGSVQGELDKVCAASVQDLMATIAKLDSNGVQVVAEAGQGEPAPSPAPHVHSSTDSDQPAPKPADPNEDWCAVCMDGGELMCCDKCPKVFHQYCHIPTIDKLPDETETWQCLLCVNFAELPLRPGEDEVPPGGGLTARQQKLVERITLELYCQYETSLPFREPIPAHNTHYHSKIARPMCLDAIRMKLQPRSPTRYTHVSQFVADCRLLFRNAYQYNPPDSQFYKDAKRLEEFFDAQLLKWVPEYAYWSGPTSPPPAKRPRSD